MKNFKIVVQFLSILPLLSIGQDTKSDITKSSYEDIKQLFFNKSNSTLTQIGYANAYIKKGKNDKINSRIARGNYLLALVYYDNNNRTIEYLDSVIKYSKKDVDTIFPAAAYREKADFLVKENKFREAVANYNEAEKYALKNNIDYYYVIRDAVATTKSENLGEITEALEIYKECYNYYLKKDFRNKKYFDYYIDIIFGLADVYKSLNQTDSCSYYNKLGYKESNLAKSEEFKYLFVLNEGANHTLRGNYKIALDSIRKALPKMILYNNAGNILASYFYKGKAYQGMGDKKMAVLNYKKVDSLYNLRKKITPEFISGYMYLISYYKDIGDKENQLKYLTKYMEIDSVLQRNYKELYKTFSKEYDIPRLVKRKENLIEQLSLKNLKYVYVVGALLLIIVILFFNQYRLNKLNKKKFNKIVNEYSSLNNISNPTESIDKNSTVINIEKEIGISNVLVSDILEKLEDFENSKDYLKQNITIQSLSDELKTNSKYLSKIINYYKKKSFTNYINDLRIEQAIITLQKDIKMQKYTLQAIAIEFGFNNAESFSKAFSKKTGIKPSFFIKELGSFQIFENQ